LRDFGAAAYTENEGEEAADNAAIALKTQAKEVCVMFAESSALNESWPNGRSHSQGQTRNIELFSKLKHDTVAEVKNRLMGTRKLFDVSRSATTATAPSPAITSGGTENSMASEDIGWISITVTTAETPSKLTESTTAELLLYRKKFEKTATP
jgi:hypothetical protein